MTCRTKAVDPAKLRARLNRLMLKQFVRVEKSNNAGGRKKRRPKPENHLKRLWQKLSIESIGTVRARVASLRRRGAHREPK